MINKVKCENRLDFKGWKGLKLSRVRVSLLQDLDSLDVQRDQIYHSCPERRKSDWKSCNSSIHPRKNAHSCSIRHHFEMFSGYSFQSCLLFWRASLYIMSPRFPLVLNLKFSAKTFVKFINICLCFSHSGV